MTAMEPQGRKRVTLKAGLLAGGLLLGLGPVTAWAQDCPPGVTGMIGGVLVETIERVDWLTTDEGEVHRLASAKEVGELTGGCGTFAVLQGRMKVQPAVSKVPVVGLGDPVTGIPDLGSGPISGDIKLYGAGGGVLKGTMGGWLDFGPTNYVPDADHPERTPRCPGPSGPGPCPFVWASGTWSIPTLSLDGGFGGVALVPFPCAAPNGYCYLDVTGALSGQLYSIVPLTVEETQPEPSAKFVITLFQ